MKILEINKFFYARRGAELHFLDVTLLLEKSGHDVAVFSMQHPENKVSKWEQYFVSHCGYNTYDSTLWERMIGTGRLFWSFEARRKLRILLDEFHPDIVHVHNAYHQLSLSFFPLIKKAGIPFIMTVHDYAMISPDKDMYSPEIGKQYWKFLRVKKYGFGKRLLLVLKKYWEDAWDFYDNIDRFIVPSRFVESILLSAGIPKEKIVILPHFISESESDVMPATDAALPEKYLFSFGAISKEKGIETLLHIAKSLDIPLVLAGRIESGFDPSEHPQVIYLGMRKKSELNSLISPASVVISASTLPETFGLTALETIALGKPFFGLDRGALSEIIENGANGFLAHDEAELQKNISRFLSREVILKDTATIQSNAYEKFGETVYLRKFQAVYTSLTRNG